MAREVDVRKVLVGVRAVVVASDPEARQLLGTVVGYCGAVVAAAVAPDEAAEAVRRLEPDVVLADVDVLDDEGAWFAGETHGLPGPGVPVLALLATPDGHRRDRFDGALVKPVHPWQLCRMLADLARQA